jgi:hypothetical protein
MCTMIVIDIFCLTLSSLFVMSPRPSPVVNMMYKMNCKYVL